MHWPTRRQIGLILLPIFDSFLSAGLTYILCVAAWAFLSWLPGGLLFMALFAAPLFLIMLGFISASLLAVPIYGLVRGRYGFLLGPILLAIAIHAHSSSRLQRSEQAAAALAAFGGEPSRRDHALLAIDGPGSYDQAGMKVLATSTHTVAIKKNSNRSPNWTLYTPASGSICLAKENATRALEFLRFGYPGTCAILTSIADFEDGLILREQTYSERSRPTSELPIEFRGEVDEKLERTAGQDKLLARRIKGSMALQWGLPLAWFEKKPQRLDLGPPIDPLSFLADAIGIAPDLLEKPADPFPYDQVLKQIEEYFGRKEIVGYGATSTIEELAAYTWQGVASTESRQWPGRLKQRMLDLFATQDPFRIELGLSLIYNLQPSERVFSGADDLMLDLMFIPLSKRNPQLETMLGWQFGAGRPPPTPLLREKARAHLDDADLAPWQRQLLKQISEL